MALRTERSTKECDKDMEKGVSIRASGTRWRGGEREISGRILYELRNRLSGFEIFALGSVTISDAGRRHSTRCVDVNSFAVPVCHPVPSIGQAGDRPSSAGWRSGVGVVPEIPIRCCC